MEKTTTIVTAHQEITWTARTKKKDAIRTGARKKLRNERVRTAEEAEALVNLLREKGFEGIAVREMRTYSYHVVNALAYYVNSINPPRQKTLALEACAIIRHRRGNGSLAALYTCRFTDGTWGMFSSNTGDGKVSPSSPHLDTYVLGTVKHSIRMREGQEDTTFLGPYAKYSELGWYGPKVVESSVRRWV